MPLPHQKFREIVFHLLYTQDFTESVEEDSIALLMNTHAVAKSAIRKALERVVEIKAKLDPIDASIREISVNYDFERISRVEKNILRLGVFELQYDSSVPPKVAIAEAIRLCRKYATAEGGNFVNALLDQIYRKDRKGECNDSCALSAGQAAE